MTENGAFYTSQDPAWQLLAEFSARGEPGSEQWLAERVTGAVQELGLRPEQVRRVRQAIQGAVRHALIRGNQEQQNLSAAIRIGISAAYAQDPSPSGPHARRGWGFFLIEKHLAGPRAANAEPHHVIELLLYQESTRAEKKRLSKKA